MAQCKRRWRVRRSAYAPARRQFADPFTSIHDPETTPNPIYGPSIRQFNIIQLIPRITNLSYICFRSADRVKKPACALVLEIDSRELVPPGAQPRVYGNVWIVAVSMIPLTWGFRSEMEVCTIRAQNQERTPKRSEGLGHGSLTHFLSWSYGFKGIKYGQF